MNKKIGRVLLILIFLANTLFGCGKHGLSINLENVDVSEIKKIEHIGTTDGIDGDYSYSLSDNQIVEFIDLLNQVKLGDKVNENKALSTGVVSYYTIYFVTDETLTISPGKFFKIGDTFYEFDNYDKLWGEFIVLNSVK